MIMELLGKSLESLVEKNNSNKVFSLKTVTMIGLEMVKLLEQIHSKDIIHRDIKPDNFAIGYEDPKKIYILDFGLAKKFRNSSTLKHNPLIKNKKLTGTARYASINALQGLEQSRRDDLESVGYVLLYFLRGRLPWQGLVVKGRENKYEKILNKKRDTDSEDLCQGFPKQYENYLDYCKNLGYEQEPDYAYLKSLFEDILKEEEMTLDYSFDWVVNNPPNEGKNMEVQQKFIVEQNNNLHNENNEKENNTQKNRSNEDNNKDLNQNNNQINNQNNNNGHIDDNYICEGEKFYQNNQIKIEDKKEETDNEEKLIKKINKKICCTIF